MARTLYVVDAAADPGRLRAALAGAVGPVDWVYLCQDYVGLLRWERELGSRFRRISTRTELAETIERLRGPYLNLIAQLGRNHDSLAWWVTRISERNTAVSPLFLFCCYHKLVSNLLASHYHSLCIVVESRALASLTEDEGRHHGYSTRHIRAFNKDHLLAWPRALFRVIRFLISGLSQRRIDDGFASSTQPLLLLRTWVSEDCLPADGVFKDRYLPGLQSWLDARGFEIAYLPVLHNLQRDVRSAWNWLRVSPLRFLNPYRFYALADYMQALHQAWRARGLPIGTVILEGADVSQLFREARELHAFDAGTLDALLTFSLPRRLRERGIEIGLFVDEYENMIPEKALLAGFRRYSPRTRLVAFQHGALYPSLLCNFVTREEAKIAPLPDRIVCNGSAFRKILAQEGLPEERLVAGPALRYQHLWNDSARDCERSGIFVPMPMVRGDAGELLTKLIAAFADYPGISVRLKVHPSASLQIALAACGIASLPENFRQVYGDIGPMLRGARVVIALSSSALYEALAAGVPFVSVGRESALDLNPLGWYEDFKRQFYTPDEIRTEALRMFDLPPAELETFKVRARHVLETSFGRVTDDAMMCFIEGADLAHGISRLPSLSNAKAKKVDS